MTEMNVESNIVTSDGTKVTESHTRLGKASFTILSGNTTDNPWSSQDVDKFESMDLKNYRKVVEACRFFYRRDPLAATVMNKMVDIGINDIKFSKNGISDSEYKIYEALDEKLEEFAENMALEFLLSGLVVPEIKFAPVTKDELKKLGIKRYDNLTLPVSMYVRDPSSIIINQTFLSDEPTLYLEIPPELIHFIQKEGIYPDGTVDRKLYELMLAYYPAFVTAVKENNVKTWPLENDNVIRRRSLTDSPYPIPYLYPAIEPMKHKRNLRRMDYSIAARVISAIQLVKLGSDEFPITENDQDQFDAIKQQMLWRNGTNKDVERIFQLFANHTLQIEWVVPPVDALLNETKYKDVNDDIIYAMGFPRILITGETLRSNTSDAQLASISPIKTLQNFRHKIETVLQYIVDEIASKNKFKNAPEVSFEPLQLSDFKTFVDAVSKLYETKNLSRSSFSEIFGFSWEDEMDEMKKEQTILDASGIRDFDQKMIEEQQNKDLEFQKKQTEMTAKAQPDVKPTAKPAAEKPVKKE